MSQTPTEPPTAGFPQQPWNTVGWMPPPGGPPPRKPKRWGRRIRLVLLALVVVIAGVAVVGSLVSHPKAAPKIVPSSSASSSAPALATDPNGQQCPTPDVNGYCPGDSPTPTVHPATKVTFVVTGWGNPSITYGSDSDNRDGGGHLGQLGDGNGLPWKRSIAFSGDAQYYSIDAQLEGSGDISCKIVVSGPGDAPLTVSSGHASGGYNVCSAQAAPSDSTGTSWQNEE